MKKPEIRYSSRVVEIKNILLNRRKQSDALINEAMQISLDGCYEKMLRQFVEWLGLLENRLTPDSSLSLVDRQALQAHLEIKSSEDIPWYDRAGKSVMDTRGGK